MKSVLDNVGHRIDSGKSWFAANMKKYSVVRQQDYGSNKQSEASNSCAYSDDEDGIQVVREDAAVYSGQQDEIFDPRTYNFFDSIVGIIGDADTPERRNDREEIRRKLAMDTDAEESFCGDRVNRKPSLSTRLQGSKNLQICFMNETASDQEGENGNTAPPNGAVGNGGPGEALPQTELLGSQNGGICTNNKAASLPSEETLKTGNGIVANDENAPAKRPSFFFNRRKSWRQQQCNSKTSGQGAERQKEDFAACQARLQAEARLALAQAKEMARMQMEVERQQKKKSPIADIVGITFPDGRHRLTRPVLTDMNVAQLQVIVNDLHSQIESHNEDLVKFLMERDDLHMEQDSMLVDIEDLTRYLGAKSCAQSDSSSLASQVKANAK